MLECPESVLVYYYRLTNLVAKYSLNSTYVILYSNETCVKESWNLYQTTQLPKITQDTKESNYGSTSWCYHYTQAWINNKVNSWKTYYWDLKEYLIEINSVARS